MFWISVALVLGWIVLPIVALVLFLFGLCLMWLFRAVESLTRRIPTAH
jgi:hypothetical protein